MELEDIFPDEPEFTLISTGETYHLRLPNIEDRLWLKQTFGSQDQIKKVFEETQWDKIIKIAYRLLVEKSQFMAKEIEEINDEGISIKKLCSGPLMMLKAITSETEMLKIVGAINSAFAKSEPLIAEAMKEAVKKNLQDLTTGDLSSTNLQVNTVGQSSTS